MLASGISYDPPFPVRAAPCLLVHTVFIEDLVLSVREHGGVGTLFKSLPEEPTCVYVYFGARSFVEGLYPGIPLLTLVSVWQLQRLANHG